ncbi:hypothetical protein [Paracoccus laeviglucosivorans]|uniref:Uncharacterized protein n=1 Tax=Paracoccus laeviglucosivorans TaxID=1197861 RepID=A0A521BF55_9RHOB|nr:hypothetical protein [Paracoccus laeviglucosivorans]SMO45735.1 hypothetical protein SAMN06265221_102268 [Paracoccus laeviglucosivorans]
MRLKFLTAMAASFALGCGVVAYSQTEGQPSVNDASLAPQAKLMEDRIAAFLAKGPQGARLPLTEITDFDWDSVRPFYGAVARETFQQVLGDTAWLDDPAIADAGDEAVRLVFLKDGKVVGTAVATPPVWLLEVKEEPMGRDAALVVTTPDPGPYYHMTLE